MKIGGFDTNEKVLIIAEIGNNHEGDEETATQMIDAAAKAGVDAVKFQTFKTELFIAPSQEERYQRMQRFELSQDAFARLAERAKAAGLMFISTPFDLPSAAFLNGLVDAMKIASGDNDFFPLIEAVAATDKPLIISTGLADETLIRFVDGLVQKCRAGRVDLNYAFLHCVSAYPTLPTDANIAAVRTLSALFPHTTPGYSDHTKGIAAAPLAVAAGARIIEKHFTLDRNFSDFRDHQLSADPGMMADIVAAVRQVEETLGDGTLAPRSIEIDATEAIRRSIAAARDLNSGDIIGPADIMWIRPGNGYRPGEEKLVLGRKLSARMERGDVFQETHFADEALI